VGWFRGGKSGGLYVMAVGCMEAFCGWFGLEVMDWDRIGSMVDIPQQLDKAKGNLCTLPLSPSIPSSELLMNGSSVHCKSWGHSSWAP
jgi:hypothetical protein